MDTDHFDALPRRLALGLNRRRGLGLIATLGLSCLGSADVAAAKNKKYPPCKKRKKGKCKKKLPDGTGCAGGTCQNGSCVAASAPVAPACGVGGPCRVFVSSTLYSGALGGLSGADAKCQGLAESAGLPGTYKAWLSDSNGSPFSRFVPSSGPYQLVNGTTIAVNWTDLTDGHLLAPISVTETGGGAISNAWTHTRTDGARDGVANGHCSNWSMNAGAGDDGDPEQSDPDWTGWLLSSCAFHRYLYCFQQS
jgi:hypothetical protein